MLNYNPKFNTKDKGFVDKLCKRYDRKYPNPNPKNCITNNFAINHYVRVTSYFNAYCKSQLSLLIILFLRAPVRYKCIFDIPVKLSYVNGHKHGYITNHHLNHIPQSLLKKITSPEKTHDGTVKPRLKSFYHSLEHGLYNNKKPGAGYDGGFKKLIKHSPNAPYIIGDVRIVHNGTMSDKACENLKEHTDIKPSTLKFLRYNGFTIVRTYNWNRLMTIVHVKKYAKSLIKKTVINTTRIISKDDANKLYKYSNKFYNDCNKKVNNNTLGLINQYLNMSSHIKSIMGTKRKVKVKADYIYHFYLIINKINVNHRKFPWGTKGLVKKDSTKIRNLLGNILDIK